MKTNNNKNNKDNKELYREYGFFNNIFFSIKAMYKYKKVLILFQLVFGICITIQKYLYSIEFKIIVDSLTGNAVFNNVLYKIILLLFISLIVSFLQSYISEEKTWGYVYVRYKLLRNRNEKAMTMDYENLENPVILDCYSRSFFACCNNLNGIEGMFHCIEDCITSLFVVIIGFCIINSLSIFISLLLILLAFISFLIISKINKYTKQNIWDPLIPWKRRFEYIQQIITNFNTAKEIRLYNLKNWLFTKVQNINSEKIKAQRENSKFCIISNLTSSLIWIIANCIIYYWLVKLVNLRQISIGNFSLYLTSSSVFYTYTVNFFSALNRLMQETYKQNDFRAYIDFKGQKSKGDLEIPSGIDYEFEFKNVSFKYPNTNNFILKNINIKIKAGEKLAIVGLNGAGKTTFVKLLLRLYEPTSGVILLNDIPINKYNIKSWFTLFSPVFQDAQVLSFSLAENIGMMDAAYIERERIDKILNAIGLSYFFYKKNGIDTPLLRILSEDGIELSGGEKQKIFLARALYKNAPVIIFDEPTAALDVFSEQRLYENFSNLTGNKTSIFITHRLCSTKFCSSIAVFSDGIMCEYGTHYELLKQNGIYKKLFETQAKYYKYTKDNKEK